MSRTVCSDCKRQTEVVLDVLESHSTDETAGKDPARVGGPTNPLLNDTALSTRSAKRKPIGSNSERGLAQAFETIATMSDRLGLAANIKDRANEIYKSLDYQKSSWSKNWDALLAACLYIACRQEDKPRTLNEICSVANGVTKKDICRAKERILKQLEMEEGQSTEMGPTHARDLITRFCSHLGMNNQATKAAQESVQKAEEFYIKRSPLSVAAVLIYIITQLSDDKKPLEDISLVTGIAQLTIKKSYKNIYPHISKIIPSWYATEEDLKNLSSP